MTIFFDGDYIIGDSIPADINAPYLTYGAGFFETLLYDGKAVELERHVNRLRSSCAEFGFACDFDDYSTVIDRLAEINGLADRSAKVNIYHMVKNDSHCAVCIKLTPYSPPPADKVFRLCVYPHVHESYLSGHKSMNYMHFMLAKRYAVSRGFDDCVLTGADGSVLETSSASLVFADGDRFILPSSVGRLAGITEQIFCEQNSVEYKSLRVGDILSLDAYVMNSLMGIRNAVIVF